MALGWSREEVIDLFPSYARYFDAMAALTEPITSPYLRFHAGHALARACMQTTIIDQVLEAGFDGFAIARRVVLGRRSGSACGHDGAGLVRSSLMPGAGSAVVPSSAASPMVWRKSP